MDAEVEARLLSEGRLWVSLRGRHTENSFGAVEQCMDRALDSAEGQADIFIDALLLEDLSPEFRDRCVAWFGLNRRWLRRIVVLQNSVRVRLAMKAVDVATGGLVETCSTQSDFEQAWVNH